MFKLRTYTRTILKRTMSTKETDVVFESLNNAGIVTLNRPKALNSLNNSMVTKLLHRLQEMENNEHLVIIKGAGDKAFCAGGNVKAVFENIDRMKFVETEYNVIYLINKYKIPYVALSNGITFGAGLGMSALGRYRVVTENSVIAVPENKIGLLPDAGASYFLPRLKDNLGIYLGLTGDILKGKDVVKIGVGTHFVSSNRLSELEKLLSKCTNDVEVQNVLNKFNEPLMESNLIPNINHIKYCFGASTIEEIIERLEKVQNDWSFKTLETLHQLSPGSLKITLRALHHGAQLELWQCLQMEFRVVNRTLENHDFPEGVRALLVDKDGNPQWNPKTLTEVGNDYVESHFTKFQHDRELKFYDT